jgi:hypothetical protein
VLDPENRYQPEFSGLVAARTSPSIMEFGSRLPTMSNTERSAGRPPRLNPPLRGRPADPVAEGTDVVCAGMYRACSTWQYTVAAHLVERHLGGRRLGYLSGEEYAARPARPAGRPHAPMGLARAATGSAWTVFKSHDGDRFFARALANRRLLVLYAYRDVRDVVFSLMHKRGLTFAQLVRQGMLQQVLRNDGFWTRHGGVLIQKYENLIENPAAGVAQIAGHLGIAIDGGEAAAIASEYSADANRARLAALQEEIRGSGVDLDDTSNQQLCDPRTLLHWNHLRPARVETWRELATPRQRGMLERFFGDWLDERGYPRDDGGSGHTIGDELDVLRGWVACRLHAAALDYPRAARLAKRVLGRGGADAVGAVAWQDAADKASDRTMR